MNALLGFPLAALALWAHGVSAQTAPSSSLRNQALGAPSAGPAAPAAPAGQWQPLQPLTPSVKALPQARTAPQSAPDAKAELPEGLFKMDDRAIIIVGGKPKQAGEIKRALAAELRQLSGPPQTKRSGSRLAGAAPQQLMHHKPVHGVRTTADAGRMNSTVSTKQNSGALAGAVTGPGGVRDIAIHDRAAYCKSHAPEITRVRGALSPNQRFTIEGLCFGATNGAVQVIGQFPGGNMKLVFERWADGEIVAFVPAVRGAADHAVAVTVVRADKTPTAAAQAYFVAARERVEVPGRYWQPGEHFTQIDVAAGGGNIFSGYVIPGSQPVSYATPFVLSINTACALDDAAWTSSTGRVLAFNGWENGPPHEAKVSVAWSPRCTTHTTDYIVATNSQTVCSVGFSVKAWAQCPLGVAP
jgi:hypothetical protein